LSKFLFYASRKHFCYFVYALPMWGEVIGLLGFCCDLDPVDGCCLLWVGYDLLVLVVAICCGLVVVGVLDCCGSPTWGVVVRCGGFLV
jgi:hypothetical protein